MNPNPECAGFREQMVLQHAGELPDDGELLAHLAACGECVRYAELSQAAWDFAGSVPEEPVPDRAIEGACDRIERLSRRPRRIDLTLLRPGAVAAAALILLGAALLLWRPEGAGPVTPMESGGTSIERYELPAGRDAAEAAEELRREVCPEAWKEGEAGIEACDGYLRVRAPAEVHRAIREHFARRR